VPEALTTPTGRTCAGESCFPADRGYPMGYRCGMESPRERACPNCGAPAAGPQRWCLECGHELPGARRPGLRPAVGIATTLAVLVGAASAGGYTLLQNGKQPPPPATTVAQAPPATQTAPTSPATQEPAPYTPTPYTPAPGASGSNPSHATSTFPTGSSSSSGAGTTGGANAGTHGSSGGGSVQQTTPTTTATTPPKSQLALSDIALGAAAVVYAPYASNSVDLGDPSLTVDGSTSTAWKAPAASDPTASPQVGVYVDLASKETIRTLVLQTPTPGMSVEVYGATSGPPASITDAGWDHLASRSSVAAKTKIKLAARPYRYVLVWITRAPPDGARPAISELSLLSLQPE
jgi:hypothetical protein